MSGFKQFLLRGNVVELAVAVVIGVAFGSVVTAFVTDLVTPLIGVFGGVPDFAALSFTINGSTFLIGHFINAVLAFVIITAATYFLVVVPYSQLIERTKRPVMPELSTTRECPECLSKIPSNARRCAYCTSEVSAVVQSPPTPSPSR